MIDIDLLKEECRGKWTEVLSALAGIPAEILDGKGHPCPRCGGKDRFAAFKDVSETGGVLCRQCGTKNGDGIASMMWMSGCDFKTAAQALADYLGYGPDEVQSNVVAEMAWRKRTGLDSLVAFGAAEAMRGPLKVCRVPMYDADLKRVGDFDLAPGELDKGKMTPGSKHGLFVSVAPKPGETVVIVEGVKDAAAIHRELSVRAVGLPTCRMDASFARLFRDCNVVIIPDRDKAGTDGAQETAAALYGVATTVSIAELPAEYQETGGADTRDVLAMRDGPAKVQSAIEHAKPWKPGKNEQRTIYVLSEIVHAIIAEEDQSAKLLKLGLPGTDKALGGGVLPSEMIIVAGRPSHGKTVAGMQCIDTLSLVVPCLALSEEMSHRQLAQRSVCGITDTPLAEWYGKEQEIRSAASRHYSKRKPVYIVESSGTVQRAIEMIDYCVEAHKIGAVMVDYMQLLRGQGASRYEQVSDVSTRLKQVAIQHNLVLIAVCQLNRSVETRGNARETTTPRMSDLRDSGQLEQDTDVILFVEWLWRTSPTGHQKEDYRIVVAKNRNRAIDGNGFVNCLFKPERQRLYVKEGHEESSERETAFDGYDQGFGF